jgi:hypothetical protein
MAVTYVARKCNQCAGKLEYINDKKVWKCLYCGAEIERAEQYDGLFTIKNVVRQVLLDVAYRRLDGAEKNLTECEKIDARYVGTIIAKIAYQMITAISPGAAPQTDSRNLFAQLKRNYEALCAIDQNVSGDEEALYEFFDNADVYATLLLVYDSLNDAGRRDCVAALLNAKEVYAKEPNKDLLRYALKNAKYELIDEIMGNPDNVDAPFALDALLQKYPDNENKVKNIERLLTSQSFKPEDKKILDGYLANSSDAPVTKGRIIALAYAANIRASLEEVVVHLLVKADRETVKSVLDSVCASRLNDDDVYRIVAFSTQARSADVAIAALNALKDTNQYVMMTSKQIIALLSRADLSAADKVAVLKALLAFNADAKSKDAVINNYLCFNNDTGETRLAVIPVLLDAVSVIQTSTVENYVLNVNADGANKPSVTTRIFSLDLNISFFNDLLTRYMNSATDAAEVKDKIIAVLIEKGLKIDPGALIDYICRSTDAVPDKIRFVKKMLSNGTQMRSDTANAYLETVSPERFDSELFALLVGSAGNISERALSNYLLRCKDRDASKVKNFTALAKQCHKSISDLRCDAVCCGQTISGNMLPVYVLSTPDSADVTKEIADFLIGNRAKLNTDISASGMGTVKFKRFVSANQQSLSPITNQICAFYRI